MKKSYGLLLILLPLLTIMSCKKDYKCTCTMSDATSGQTIIYPLVDMTKGEAEDSCSASETYHRLYYANATCSME